MVREQRCDICNEIIKFNEYEKLLTCYNLDEIFIDDQDKLSNYIKKLEEIDKNILTIPMPEFTENDVCKSCYKKIVHFILDEIINIRKENER